MLDHDRPGPLAGKGMLEGIDHEFGYDEPHTYGYVRIHGAVIDLHLD